MDELGVHPFIMVIINVTLIIIMLHNDDYLYNDDY